MFNRALRAAVFGLTAIAVSFTQPLAAHAASTSHAAPAFRTASIAHAAPASSAAHAAAVNPAAATHPAAVSPAAQAARLRSLRIVAAARAERGKPYRYGASGPSAFDCSGLTGYAYRTQHLTLPRTADQQFRLARPVARAAARPGDLVFWVSGGHAFHAAIYAGAGQVWHAPHTGRRVQLETIWSWNQVHFGRIGL